MRPYRLPNLSLLSNLSCQYELAPYLRQPKTFFITPTSSSPAMSMKAMLRPILHRAVACARVQSSCVLFSQLYPCNRLLFLRQVSSSLPSHNTSAQDLQRKLLREVQPHFCIFSPKRFNPSHSSPNPLLQPSQHEEAEAAFATERSQRVPELARAATDMMKFQDTPNPNSLKFVPGCPVLGVGGGTLDLPTARAAMVIRNNLSPPRCRHHHYFLRYLLLPKQYFVSTTFQASRVLQSVTISRCCLVPAQLRYVSHNISHRCFRRVPRSRFHCKLFLHIIASRYPIPVAATRSCIPLICNSLQTVTKRSEDQYWGPLKVWKVLGLVS